MILMVEINLLVKIMKKKNTNFRRDDNDDVGFDKPSDMLLKIKNSLPDTIIPFENRDKGFHEKWTPGRSLMNFPHPFSWLIFAKPNAGKTTLVKNHLWRATPGYDKIYVLHTDPGTAEYGSIPVSIEPPQLDDIDRTIKNLLVIDDFDIEGANRETKNLLDRLFGYARTHLSLSIIIINQNLTRIPTTIRRMCTIVTHFQIPNSRDRQIIGRMIGMDRAQMSKINGLLEDDFHASFTIDRTKNSPMKYRLNMTESVSIDM